MCYSIKIGLLYWIWFHNFCLTFMVNCCFVLYLDLTQVICNEINDNSDNKLYDKQISSVCKDSDDNKYKCTCFSISKLEDEMIQNFIIYGKYKNGFNIVFKYYWDQQIISSDIKMVKDVSFDDVYKSVWKKTTAQCQLVLVKLNDKSITLKEIESLHQLFIPKDTNIALDENEKLCQREAFSSQLCALCSAIHQCNPSSSDVLPPPNTWIPQTVAYIELYNALVVDSKCTEAARVIMKVKKSLKLENDFKIIEDLANRVCFM